jgi:hypothetical protein
MRLYIRTESVILVLQMFHYMIVLPATGEGTVKTHERTRCSQSTSFTGRKRNLAAYMSMGKAPREKHERVPCAALQSEAHRGSVVLSRSPGCEIS